MLYLRYLPSVWKFLRRLVSIALCMQSRYSPSTHSLPFSSTQLIRKFCHYNIKKELLLLQTHRYSNPVDCSPVVVCYNAFLTYMWRTPLSVSVRVTYGVNPQFSLRCFIEIIGMEFPYFIEKTRRR